MPTPTTSKTFLHYESALHSKHFIKLNSKIQVTFASNNQYFQNPPSQKITKNTIPNPPKTPNRPNFENHLRSIQTNHSRARNSSALRTKAQKPTKNPRPGEKKPRCKMTISKTRGPAHAHGRAIGLGASLVPRASRPHTRLRRTHRDSWAARGRLRLAGAPPGPPGRRYPDTGLAWDWLGEAGRPKPHGAVRVVSALALSAVAAAERRGAISSLAVRLDIAICRYIHRPVSLALARSCSSVS